MSLAIAADPLPLRTDSDATVRIGGTRVTLDTVVEALREGLTAEEIAQQYPVVGLPDVYAAIAYYLRHLHDRETKAATLRAEAQARSPNADSESACWLDDLDERVVTWCASSLTRTSTTPSFVAYGM